MEREKARIIFDVCPITAELSPSLAKSNKVINVWTIFYLLFSWSRDRGSCTCIWAENLLASEVGLISLNDISIENKNCSTNWRSLMIGRMSKFNWDFEAKKFKIKTFDIVRRSGTLTASCSCSQPKPCCPQSVLMNHFQSKLSGDIPTSPYFV